MDFSVILPLVPAQYAVYVAAICGVCAAVATVLPPPSAASGAYSLVYKVVNVLAANVGHAKNANTGAST
jgi:hypothetical protein